MSILAESNIYDLIVANSSITDLLDTYTDKDSNVKYAVFNGNVVPEWFKGDDYINFYQVGLFSGIKEYVTVDYSINCRASTNKASKNIALEVFQVMNRYNIGSANFTGDILATIPPADSTDLYNTPLEIRAFKRSI